MYTYPIKYNKITGSILNGHHRGPNSRRSDFPVILRVHTVLYTVYTKSQCLLAIEEYHSSKSVIFDLGNRHLKTNPLWFLIHHFTLGHFFYFGWIKKVQFPDGNMVYLISGNLEDKMLSASLEDTICFHRWLPVKVKGNEVKLIIIKNCHFFTHFFSYITYIWCLLWLQSSQTSPADPLRSSLWLFPETIQHEDQCVCVHLTASAAADRSSAATETHTAGQ